MADEATFELLEFQRLARETCCPRKLFELWENVCERYERNEIGIYELDEMKSVIWPGLKALASLRRAVNEAEDVVSNSESGKARRGHG
jgi:hypothetical protein